MATDGTALLTSPDDELTRLRQENELLRAVRQQLTEQLEESQRSNASLQHQLQNLLRRHFGRSAEKIDPKQMLLFQSLLEQLAPETKPADATADAATANAPAESAAASSAAPPKSGHGRRKLPRDLPRRTVLHDLPENEKPCPCCGTPRHVIGREVSEQLEYVPARLTVIEHVRLTYACRQCEQSVAESGAQVVTADKPSSPIEKGLAGPGLLSYIIVSKYSDHLPLHRLERILERHGIELSRQTMCGWMAQCAAALAPLYDRMVHQVLQSKVIHTDDTPVDVLDCQLDQTRTGRFWVYLGDKDYPFTVFSYTASRSRDGPMQFLEGWGRDRRVYLQADAFGGYDGIYAGQAGGQVTEVACWAHARRKFYEARTSDAALSTQALAYIRLLYDVEDEAKEQFASQEDAAPSHECVSSDDAHTPMEADATSAPRSLSAIRLGLRQEKAVPRLGSFKEWLHAQQVEHGGSILPKSPMGQAIRYAMNQWDALCVYTTDGELNIDNNASENTLRRVALGRKNWLFAGSDNGGRTAATLFSLIATCQRHKVEPFAYLRDVLIRLATTPVSQLDALLPGCWKPVADAAVH